MVRKVAKAVLAVVAAGLAAGAFLLLGPLRAHTLDTALFYAARNGSQRGAAVAKGLGADVDTRDVSGTPLIMLLAADDNHAMIGWLLANGAAVDAADPAGDTALTAAADAGAMRSAEVLLAAGADPDPKSNGHSPLQLAIWGKHFALAKAILRSGATTGKRDHAFGATSLLDAIDAGDHETIALLLERGANPRVTDRFGWSPLHKAAFLGRRDVAELLLKHGVEVDIRDKDGWSPLMIAIMARHVPMMHFLLGQGADPNGAALDGRTPLMKAASFGDMRMIKPLMDRGADAAPVDIRGWDAAYFANVNGFPDAAELLRRSARRALHARRR